MQRVAASKQVSDLFHITLGEGDADFGGRDLVGRFAGEQFDHFDLEPELLPECFEGVGVAAALAAESKVLANDQAGQLELLDQHADKIAGVRE